MPSTKASMLKEQLRLHIESEYDTKVEDMVRLDRGVFRVVRADGPSWVARMFPAGRTLAQAQDDASVLRFLEDQGFPAERCVGGNPATAMDGRAVLVTTFLEGGEAEPSLPTLHALGALFGRLEALPGGVDVVDRAAGALHHYAVEDGGPSQELAAAMTWLAAVEERVPAAKRKPFELLQESLAGADTCQDLPMGLIHPDPVLKNALVTSDGELALIDWTGAGRGPRLSSVAVLVWNSSLDNGTWVPSRVDAIVDGYRSHAQLSADEAGRLGDVMRNRQLVFAAFRYRHAVMEGETPTGDEWWWPSDELTDAVAGEARDRFLGAR